MDKSVALRKESVDRNCFFHCVFLLGRLSLSARRAWIEIFIILLGMFVCFGRSPQGERG